MKTTRVLTMIPLLLLGGCAMSYCEAEQDYQTAASVSAVKPVGDLRVKDSASALKIPPAPEKPVPFGERHKDEDGDDAVRCLDKPPALLPLAEPAAPAPAATPAPQKAPS